MFTLFSELISLSCSIILNRSKYKLNFSIRSMSDSQIYISLMGASKIDDVKLALQKSTFVIRINGESHKSHKY